MTPPFRTPSPEILQRAIEASLANHPKGKSRAPAEIARELAPENWRQLLPYLKRAGADLARQNRLVILRKGRPVEPDEARGVVRWRLQNGEPDE